MPTVSKSIADDVIAGKYDDDCTAVDKIIKYTTPEGGDAYGLVYRGCTDPYQPGPYAINPVLYWERSC